jgi:CRISPR-associated protein Cas2
MITSQRHRWLVSYDIADTKRLRRTHRSLNGYGDAVQYSIFVCDLTPSERQVLREQIARWMHEREDCVMFVDLGPVGRGPVAIEFVGRSVAALVEKFGATIVWTRRLRVARWYRPPAAPLACANVMIDNALQNRQCWESDAIARRARPARICNGKLLRWRCLKRAPFPITLMIGTIEARCCGAACRAANILPITLMISTIEASGWWSTWHGHHRLPITLMIGTIEAVSCIAWRRRTTNLPITLMIGTIEASAPIARGATGTRPFDHADDRHHWS